MSVKIVYEPVDTSIVDSDTLESPQKNIFLCHFEGCRKKLKLTDMACRCKNIFCSIHRLPEQHECTYDFKQFNKECFIKQSGLGDGKVMKLEKI